MKIDVCVATYRRPAWLRLLLQDLAAQRFAQAVGLRVLVVDNDPRGSARDIASAFGGVRYLVQPQKNIALTRNAALDAADADWLAFVDDDERVGPDWLQTLLDAQQRFDADVVFGPVVGLLPPDAPPWVRRGGFFTTPAAATGTEQRWGATNNALLRARFVAEGARFDARFGLTGGEDTDFFYRLWQRGARLVWCQEALVSEHVSDERMTPRWLLRRNFRSGQRFADIVEHPMRGLRLWAWALRCSALCGAAALLALFTLPFNAGLALRHAGRAAAKAGQLSTLFGYRLQEYR